MARTKPEADWEAVEKEYRAGAPSIREIGRKYGLTDGAIRQRAKSHGWLRDLNEKVNQELRTELLRTDLRTDLRTTHVTEKEIVEAAVQQRASIVKIHRKDIQKQRSIIDLLSNQLGEAAGQREEIEAAIEDETKEDPDTKRRNQMLRAVSLPVHAGIVRDLSVALKNVVPLERQAYSIPSDGIGGDDGEGGSKPNVTKMELNVLFAAIKRANEPN